MCSLLLENITKNVFQQVLTLNGNLNWKCLEFLPIIKCYASEYKVQLPSSLFKNGKEIHRKILLGTTRVSEYLASYDTK